MHRQYSGHAWALYPRGPVERQRRLQPRVPHPELKFDAGPIYRLAAADLDMQSHRSNLAAGSTRPLRSAPCVVGRPASVGVLILGTLGADVQTLALACSFCMFKPCAGRPRHTTASSYFVRACGLQYHHLGQGPLPRIGSAALDLPTSWSRPRQCLQGWSRPQDSSNA